MKLRFAISIVAILLLACTAFVRVRVHGDPPKSDPANALVDVSDHRLVWMDIVKDL